MSLNCHYFKKTLQVQFKRHKGLHRFIQWASFVAQRVKNTPAMQETWVRPLGWEDPLEKGKATH